MAGQDADLNLDLGQGEKKGKKKLFLIIGIAAAVLIAGGITAFFLLKKEPAAAEGEEVKEESTEETEEIKPAVFVPIKENFVVNLTGGNRDRIAQIGVTLMSHDAEAEKVIEEYMPLIKSILLELFSAQNPDELLTVEGKEKLRLEAQKRIQDMLKTNKSTLTIDKILFSAFVMQ